MQPFYINKAFIEGVIGKKPVLTHNKNVPVCQFYLFSKEKWLSRSGDKMEKNNWFVVEVIGKHAIATSKKITEGMNCLIEGYIKYEKLNNSFGMIKVIASNIREIKAESDSDCVNNIIMAGKISSDIKIKQLSSNTKLCYFTLSFLENWKTSDGRVISKRNWIKVEILGSNVEKYRPILKKDIWLLVDGFLRFEKFMEDKSIVKIRAFSVQPFEC